TRLRQSGEAFRLGGDEFAVLLPGSDAGEALTAASSIVERISRLDFAEMGAVTVSAGIALAPQHARESDELLRLVDTALYRAKENGKNRADVYRPDVIELADLRRLVSAKDRAARLRAAASLASAVDARDVYAGNHSERVAELAVRLAARIGPSRGELAPTRRASACLARGSPPPASPAASTPSASSSFRRSCCASRNRSLSLSGPSSG